MIGGEAGICQMRAAEGWLDEARQITALLFDGLCHRPQGGLTRRTRGPGPWWW
ncbi:hypothetical protein [Actinomadura chokoriensis]|uniref:Uncharacterized protein n=1 Tax=Actinomadura chokoriensis TaxID=454156 RepID=A0ABV4QYS6_9ACTN